MKTIYLLHARQDPLHQTWIAFECKECADVQAAWYRRDRAPVTVTPVLLYAHVRDAQTHGCTHLKLARPGKNAVHEHVPMTLDAAKR